MNSVTIPLPHPKKAPAAGLFGAFRTPKPDVPPFVANDEARGDFVGDYLAGTHTHPSNSPSSGTA